MRSDVYVTHRIWLLCITAPSQLQETVCPLTSRPEHFYLKFQHRRSLQQFDKTLSVENNPDGLTRPVMQDGASGQSL